MIDPCRQSVQRLVIHRCKPSALQPGLGREIGWTHSKKSDAMTAIQTEGAIVLPASLLRRLRYATAGRINNRIGNDIASKCRKCEERENTHQ